MAVQLPSSVGRFPTKLFMQMTLATCPISVGMLSCTMLFANPKTRSNPNQPVPWKPNVCHFCDSASQTLPCDPSFPSHTFTPLSKTEAGSSKKDDCHWWWESQTSLPLQNARESQAEEHFPLEHDNSWNRWSGTKPTHATVGCLLSQGSDLFPVLSCVKSWTLRRWICHQARMVVHRWILPEMKYLLELRQYKSTINTNRDVLFQGTFALHESRFDFFNHVLEFVLVSSIILLYVVWLRRGSPSSDLFFDVFILARRAHRIGS